MPLYAAILASTARRRHSHLCPKIAVVLCDGSSGSSAAEGKAWNAAVRHKFCCPHVKHKPRFLIKNKTIFAALGQRCHKAFHRVSLRLSPRPPTPPLATEGENIIPTAEGLRQQKRRMEEMQAADGRSPRSKNPDTVRQSLHSVLSAGVSRRMKGEKAKSWIHDCRSSQPRPSVTKTSLVKRRGGRNPDAAAFSSVGLQKSHGCDD